MTTKTETPDPADGAANTATGGRAAGTDLDATLAEYRRAADPRQTTNDQQAAGGLLKELQPVIAFASQELQKRHSDQQTADISKAISFVKEDDGAKEIPDTIVRGMLEGYAAQHDDFAQAFQNRGKDPAGWQKALTTARGEVAKELSALAPTKRVASDVTAARAAVTGERSQQPRDDSNQPSPVDMFRMPEHEFQDMLKKEAARGTAR